MSRKEGLKKPHNLHTKELRRRRWRWWVVAAGLQKRSYSWPPFSSAVLQCVGDMQEGSAEKPHRRTLITALFSSRVHGCRRRVVTSCRRKRDVDWCLRVRPSSARPLIVVLFLLRRRELTSLPLSVHNVESFLFCQEGRERERDVYVLCMRVCMCVGMLIGK